MLVPAAAVDENVVAGHTDYIRCTPVAVHSIDRTHHRMAAAVAVGIAETADQAGMLARLAETFALVDLCQCIGFVVFVGIGLRRVRLARLPTS